MLKVTLEHKNGDVSQHYIDNYIWSRYIFQALELDDDIEHYTVDTVTSIGE